VIDDSTAEPVPDGEPDGSERPRRGSRSLTIAFLVALCLLGLLGAGGAAASAVEALLANPAQSCGGG